MISLRFEGTQHLAGGSCSIRWSGPYAEGNLSLIALNCKWCHFRRSSAECQMCDTFLDPLSQIFMHRRACTQVRKLDEVCQAQGGRSQSPLASLGRTLQPTDGFSPLPHFPLWASSKARDLGAEIYSLTSALRNVSSPSLSKSLHTLYFLLVNFPIRPAPVPLIQHTGFFPSILYIILINTYQSKALLIKLARWLHTPPCAPSEHPLAKIFSSLI